MSNSILKMEIHLVGSKTEDLKALMHSIEAMMDSDTSGEFADDASFGFTWKIDVEEKPTEALIKRDFK